MAAEKSPSFQFYPRDFLADGNVAGMSLQERGAYITLLGFCWLDQSLPAEETRLANMVGLTPRAFRKLWPALATCFHEADGRLIHPRLEKERMKQGEYRQAQADKGKASAANRAATKAATAESPEPQPSVNRDTNRTSTEGSTGLQPSLNRNPSLLSSVFCTSPSEKCDAPQVVEPPKPGKVFNGGAERQPKANRPATAARPAFKWGRLTVWEWFFEQAQQTLGDLYDDFEVEKWLMRFESEIPRGAALPKREDQKRWLLAAFEAELERRGITRADSLDGESRLRTTIWTCRECGELHEAYNDVAMSEPCLKRIQGDKYDSSTAGFTETRH